MRISVEKADIPAYLANVIHIASAGGKIAAKESFVLQSIIDKIDATNDDLNAARQLASRGHNKIYLPKTTHSRADNLQDMIMVALADGVISPMESEPIEKIAKIMNYSQADIDLALRRAQTELTKISRRHNASRKTPPPPPKPERRRSWRDDRNEIKKSPPPLPTPPKKQPPIPFDTASKPLPQPPPPKPDTHPAEPPPVEVPPPQTAAAPDPAPAKTNPMADCIKCRNASDNPQTYCFGSPDGPINPWGCRFSKMPWQPDAEWLKLGRFSDEATYIFDKKAIAEQLSLNLAEVLDCPHLNPTYTEKAFEVLPKRVTIGERWDYHQTDHNIAGSVTIKTTDYIHGCPVARTVIVDGIAPIGTRDALKIIRKAGRKTNTNQAAYKTLLKK
jgi:uncharacterized tellurite resistance protein B-like protein